MDPSARPGGLAARSRPGGICPPEHPRVLRPSALRRRSGVRETVRRERPTMERENPMNLLLALLICSQVPAQSSAPDAGKAKAASQEKAEKEVVVTAERRESDVMDVPAGVTVVTRA